VVLASLDGASVAGPVVGILALDSVGAGPDGGWALDGPIGEFRGVIPAGLGTCIGIPTGTIHLGLGLTLPIIAATQLSTTAPTTI
jgi:hypothetical protein